MEEIIIRTERLVIRPITTAYLDSTNEYALDPETTKFMCFLPVKDPDETMRFLRKVEKEWSKDTPDFYEFAILHDNEHIGSISVYNENGDGELGWILNKSYWRRGFAYEAARAVIDHFAGNGFTHFIAHCDTENTASYRLMEKLGMVRTAEYGGRRNRAAKRDSFEYLYELNKQNG